MTDVLVSVSVCVGEGVVRKRLRLLVHVGAKGSVHVLCVRGKNVYTCARVQKCGCLREFSKGYKVVISPCLFPLFPCPHMRNTNSATARMCFPAIEEAKCCESLFQNSFIQFENFACAV